MSPQSISDLIRTLAGSDWADAENLLPQLRQLRSADARILVAAAFTLAANQYFGPTPGPTEVADWVTDIHVRYPDDQYPLPAAHMEALIRTALGEHELVDTIPTHTLLAAELLLTGHLLREPPMTPTELEDFIAEAETLAAQHT